MHRIGRRLCVGLAVASTGILPGRAASQWTPALWVDLVQMPVAVTRLQFAGVPIADLRMFVPGLNVAAVTPTLFLESVRGISILDRWDVDRVRSGNGDGPGMGGYVQRLHDRGLRGPALADAIHRELRRRGVPAGPKRAGGRGIDVLDREFVLPRTVTRTVDLRDAILGRPDGRDDDRGRDDRGSGAARGRGEDGGGGAARGQGGRPSAGRGQAAPGGRGQGGARQGPPQQPAGRPGAARGGRGGDGPAAAPQGQRGRGSQTGSGTPGGSGRGGGSPSRGRGP